MYLGIKRSTAGLTIFCGVVSQECQILPCYFGISECSKLFCKLTFTIQLVDVLGWMNLETSSLRHYSYF